MSLLKLPNGVLLRIFDFLEVFEFGIGRTSKRLYELLTLNESVYSRVNKLFSIKEKEGNSSFQTFVEMISTLEKQNSDLSIPIVAHTTMSCDEYCDYWYYEQYFIDGKKINETFRISSPHKMGSNKSTTSKVIGRKRVFRKWLEALNQGEKKYGGDKCLMIPDTIIFKKWSLIYQKPTKEFREYVWGKKDIENVKKTIEVRKKSFT